MEEYVYVVVTNCQIALFGDLYYKSVASNIK